MTWLWTQFGRKKIPALKPRAEGQKPKVNIIGPIYGTFNMPSDLAEIRRLVEGIGAECEHGFPLGSHLADVPKLVDAEAIILHVSRVRAAACETLDRPYLQAPIGMHSTTLFLRKLGDILGLDRNPSSPARSTPPSSPFGISGARSRKTLFGTDSFGIVANETYTRGIAISSKLNSACPVISRWPASPAPRPTTEAVRAAIKQTPPLVIFGSYNERMYLAEAGGRGVYIPASFPGAVIRRHTGTPFMGYAGATYLVQEVCNALFDALFHIFPSPPTWTSRSHTGPSPRRTALDDDAKDAFDRIHRRTTDPHSNFGRQASSDAAERTARQAGEHASAHAASHCLNRSSRKGTQHDSRIHGTSDFVRVRALPPYPRAAPRRSPQSRAQRPASQTAGADAVSRAFANHAAATRVASKPKKHDAIEFRLIFTLAFAVFLLTSVIERAMPHKWAQRAGERRGSQIRFRAGREAAHISAAYAFMG